MFRKTLDTKPEGYSGPILMILLSFWRKWPPWELPGFFSRISSLKIFKGAKRIIKFQKYGIFWKTVLSNSFHKKTLIFEKTLILVNNFTWNNLVVYILQYDMLKLYFSESIT